ncbi:hypothetical protein F5B17DRAFT_429280 [Nemania serpens]|nr:hypothetical protein F5B17DRAFT_429280 [Nemania serpens]
MQSVVNGATLETLEDKVTSTVHTLIEIGFGIGSSLNAIERNTRELFWWTSWLLVVVLGLFILNLLVRVRAQLVTLNGYQFTFQRMWAEDRANEDRIRREEKRERDIRQMRRDRDPRQAARAEAYLDELVDSVGNVSDRDAEEYNAWVARMRGAVGAGFDD